MRNVIIAFILMLAAASAFSQKSDPLAFKPETIELITPWDFSMKPVKFSQERHRKSCLDFDTLSYNCGREPNVNYGARVGINWDLFNISGGYIDRTRMVEIGKYGWDDKFMIPYVEPWPELAPGERRSISVNSSGIPVVSDTKNTKKKKEKGNNVSSGIAGMNGNGTYTPFPRQVPGNNGSKKDLTPGTYATASVTEQVTSTVTDKNGRFRTDAYTPTLEVKMGYMYVAHVIEAARDFYVIIHVDDVVRGESVKLSFIKLEFTAL